MKTEDQQISDAKARAKIARIGIDRTASKSDGSLIKVTSEQDATITYDVTRDLQGKLICSCPARVICKHIGVVLLLGIKYHVPPMVDAPAVRLEARTTEGGAASVALKLTEHSERTLANVRYSQEERLQALAYLPVAIAAYAVILGPAHAWQWHEAKEAQWEKYQAARIGNYLCG